MCLSKSFQKIHGDCFPSFVNRYTESLPGSLPFGLFSPSSIVNLHSCKTHLHSRNWALTMPHLYTFIFIWTSVLWNTFSSHSALTLHTPMGLKRLKPGLMVGCIWLQSPHWLMKCCAVYWLVRTRKSKTCLLSDGKFKDRTIKLIITIETLNHWQ